MKRILALFLVVSSFVVFSGTSSASIKPGTSCSPKGKISIFGGVKYTCVLSGKKLVWNKGIKIPTASTTSTTTTFVAPTTTTTLTQSGHFTFASVLDHVGEIPLAAWNSIQDAYLANSAVTSIPLTLHLGPTTTLTDSNPVEVVQKTMRLWKNFQQPKTADLIYYNSADQDWALTTSQTIFGNCAGFNAPLLSSGGGNMGMCSTQNAVGRVLQPSSNASTYMTYGVWTHEYTHSVQTAQWIGKSSNPAYAIQQVISCWFQEGQAMAISATGTSTFAQYSSIRTNEAGRVVPSFTDYSSTAIQDFLFNQVPLSCSSSANFQLGYSVGFFTVEALVAIGGASSTMQLLVDQSNGMTFAQAFQSVYGISWLEGSKILAQVVVAERKLMGY